MYRLLHIVLFSIQWNDKTWCWMKNNENKHIYEYYRKNTFQIINKWIRTKFSWYSSMKLVTFIFLYRFNYNISNEKTWNNKSTKHTCSHLLILLHAFVSYLIITHIIDDYKNSILLVHILVGARVFNLRFCNKGWNY